MNRLSVAAICALGFMLGCEAEQTPPPGTSGTCVPPATELCDCPGGAIGSRACEPDGLGFGACQCAPGGGATDAAGGPNLPPRPTQICTPGEAVPCACGDGTTGSQICDPSGANYGPCLCANRPPPADAGSSAIPDPTAPDHGSTGTLDAGSQTPTSCIPGEQMDVGDGCNTCTCHDLGVWICTECDCHKDCPIGKDHPAGCPSDPDWWAKNPCSGTCCKYQHLCAQPDEWETFYNEESCLTASP